MFSLPSVNTYQHNRGIRDKASGDTLTSKFILYSRTVKKLTHRPTLANIENFT